MNNLNQNQNSLRRYLLGTLQGQIQLSTYLIILVGFGIASVGSLRFANKDLQHHHHMQVSRQAKNLKLCIGQNLNTAAIDERGIKQCLSTFSGWGMLSWAVTGQGDVIVPDQSFAKVNEKLLAASKSGICLQDPAQRKPQSGGHMGKDLQSESCTLDVQVKEKKITSPMNMSHGHGGQRAINPDSVYSISATSFPQSGLKIFSAEDITLHAGVDSSLLVTLLALWAGTLLASVLIIGLVVRRIISPLNELVDQADMVTAENLSPNLTFSTQQQPPHEIKQLLNSYTNLIRRLSFSWQQQQQFVSAVSHELRTPLSICSGYANRLLRKKEGLSDSQVKSLEAINEEVKRIIQLVGDLLELSRSDFGTLKVIAKEISIVEAVRESVESISARIPNKILLNIEDSAYGLRANIDPEKFKQVLINLTENASKYSSAGKPIKIEISAQSNEACRVSVVDQGMGIPAKDIPFIFERFYRASNIGDISGSGMGLSVVKMMVESMGGEVSAESTVSVGTRMNLLFPTENSNHQE